MNIIDFDARFTEVLNKWIEENRHRFRRPEDMEDEVPDVYLRWLNTPADWLEALLDVAEGDDVTYTDFIEIRSAIERLGSEAPVRDWTHDPTYQAFKRLQRAQN